MAVKLDVKEGNFHWDADFSASFVNFASNSSIFRTTKIKPQLNTDYLILASQRLKNTYMQQSNYDTGDYFSTFLSLKKTLFICLFNWHEICVKKANIA